MARTARSAHTKAVYRRRRRILLLTVLLAAGLVACSLLPHRSEPEEAGQSAASGDAADSTVMAPAPVSVLSAANAIPGAALTEAFIYGNHLGLTGALTPQQSVTGLALVLRSADGGEAALPLQLTGGEEGVSFRLSHQINGGLDLETVAEGEVLLLVRASYEDGSMDDYLLDAGAAAADLPMEYYTLTRAGANRRITLQPQQLEGDEGIVSALTLQCTAAALPAEVYDVVIDPGHGGTDAGAVAGNVYEAAVTLELALRTKAQLEALGLKVLLTRDGTEDPATMMAYTMYDEDGRVNVTAGSGAKLCFSLHLNTFSGPLDKGGVQIYAANDMDYTFAGSLAETVAAHSGSFVSPMTVLQVQPGVYARSFTRADSQELDADCAEFGAAPYRVPAGTNYYYMIRETGCRVTGAYVDGRHPHFGANIHRDSPIGVETYLCELGYISLTEDLQNILNNPDGYAAGIAAAVKARFGL